uniref:Peptidyl-prolyl cis-trans isomerase n=1 Tax=Compsopogon caeruleus TaxID=31354 RepID=A0A7S1TDS4_9RHOD|mmetsp:Transcript_18254/g.38117  ORF Transcript_18254/g.38117 Transcript_18254/m.38117 type:complete len:135 (+) Transcript_18254:86-490(+)
MMRVSFVDGIALGSRDGCWRMLRLCGRQIEWNRTMCRRARLVEMGGELHESGQVRVRHIQVDTEPMGRQVLDQVKEDGSRFEELARAISSCGTRDRGGRLGWVRRGAMVPEFERAVFGTLPGLPVLIQTVRVRL